MRFTYCQMLCLLLTIACSQSHDSRLNDSEFNAADRLDVASETIQKLLANQAIDGPNCVSAALMGRGLLSTPFNILPSNAKEQILPQCFAPVNTIEDGDFVTMRAGEVIYHVFLKVEIAPGVFSKGSLSDPYALKSLADMGHCLNEQNEIQAHCSSYRLQLSDACPLTAYEAYLRQVPAASVAARSSLYLRRVFGLISTDKPTLSKVEVLAEIAHWQDHRLVVDTNGATSDSGIDVTFLHAEMLANTRAWLNREQ